MREFKWVNLYTVPELSWQAIYMLISHNSAYLVINQILLDVSSEFCVIAILSLYISIPIIVVFSPLTGACLPDSSLLTLLVPKHTTFMLSLLQEQRSPLKKILNQFCVLPRSQAAASLPGSRGSPWPPWAHRSAQCSFLSASLCFPGSGEVAMVQPTGGDLYLPASEITPEEDWVEARAGRGQGAWCSTAVGAQMKTICGPVFPVTP